MKLKGKALLSLLLVLTLVTQLFTVSAAATGGESLVYALFAEDENGQSVPVEEWDEASVLNGSCSVTVGDRTTLSRSPSGVSLSQLMSDTLRVTPPEGWYVAELWLYGSETSSHVALPLTAADPSQSGNSRAVSVSPDALIGSNDYGSPVFDEQLLSSWASDGLYTLGVQLKRVESGEVTIYNEYTGGTDYTGATMPGHPGNSGDAAFVGWQLRYDNGASVILDPGVYVQPYASCTVSAAWAPIVTLRPRDMTVSEGTWISEVESSAQVDAYNLPSDLSLDYANAYVADAGDPLSPGAYSLRVGSFTVTDRRTGRAVESSRAVVNCEDGVVTVEAAVVQSEWVEPEQQDNGGWTEQPQIESGWVEPAPDYTPSVQTVNVTVSDQGWTYTGVPDRVGMNCLSFDPKVDGANFRFTYTDAYGNTTEDIVNAGEYTLNAIYTGGLDESLYTINIVNDAKVTIYPRALTVTAASDSKQYDGSPLVNTDFTAEGLVDGHSVSNPQFSLYDNNNGVWLSEWPSAEGSYTKMLSGVTVLDANGYDVGANYSINPVDGALTITAPPAPQTTEVVASLADLNRVYTGEAQTLDESLVQLSPWVEGAHFTIRCVDANGTVLDSAVKAGSYGLQLSYDGGLGEGYTVTLGSVGTLTVEPAPLTITAAPDAKTYDGSALVNNDYSAEGLVGGDSIAAEGGVQFSVRDENGSWLDNWPSAAGVYTKVVNSVLVVNANGENVTGCYSLTPVDGTLTITAMERSTVTATLGDQTLAYTGAAQALDTALVRLEPAVSGANFTIQYRDSFGNTLEAVTDAGSYSLVLSYTGGLDENVYSVAVGSVGVLTVTPAALTVTAASASKTYDGAPLVNNEYSAEGLLPGHSFREGDGVVFELSDSQNQPAVNALAVGSYTKSISAVHVVDGSGNEVTQNYSVSTVPGTLDIAAAERQTVHVTVPERSFVYDGQAHRFDASILTIEPVVEGVELEVSVVDSNGSTLEAVTDVGSYSLRARYVGGLDPNLYEVEIGADAALTVSPYTLTVTASSDSKTYDGSPLQNTEYTASALLDGHHFRENDPVDFIVKDKNGSQISGWPVEKGVYTKTPSAVHVLDAENRDVSANYALTAVDGTLAVAAPEIVNVTVTVSNQVFVYDGQAHSPKADEYTVQGLQGNDTVQVALKAALSNGTELDSVTEVGNYVIKASVSGYDTEKYQVTVKAGTLCVTPYGVTVTADSASKTYDGQKLESRGYSVNPALLSGHRVDESRLGFYLYAANGAALRSWPTEAGVYTKRIATFVILDASGNDVTKNYQIKFVDGNLSINAGQPTPRNFLDQNGNALRGGSYKYTKKSGYGLSIRIDADPALLKSVLVDGSEVSSQNYSVYAGSTVIAFQSTWLDTLYSGSHALRVEFTDNGYATTTFTVEDASLIPITIRGKNLSKEWDNNAYVLSANDVGASINPNYPAPSVQPRLRLVQGNMTVNSAVNPGSYDIYLDGLSFGANTPASNYAVTVVDANGYTVATNYQNTSVKIGTLTINQTNRSVTPVRIVVQDQSWTYDGTAHTLNQTAYTAEGLPSGENLTVKLSIIDGNGRTLSAVTDAGTYSIKADVSGYGSNLSVTTAGVGTLTVNPYKLTLTAESASKNYDGTVLRNTNVKATGLLNGHKFRSGDGVKFSVYDSKGNLIQNGPVNVGSYTKKVTEVHIVDGNNIEVTRNYDITRVDGTLTVLNGNGSPKTGDRNNLTLWVTLLAISAVVVLVALLILLRRGRKPRKPQAPRHSAAEDTQVRRKR